jgi:hypothetical protein
MKKLFVIIFVIYTGQFYLCAQTEFHPKEGRLKTNSSLTIKGGVLYDSIKNIDLFPISGKYVETKWYTFNDSTFIIDFFTGLPVIDKYSWQNILVFKIKLGISKDFYSITRDQSYIGYPILSDSSITSIKNHVKDPDNNFDFKKYSDWNPKDSTGPKAYFEPYLRTIGLAAITLMNGQKDLLDDFNHLPDRTRCNGGICSEVYYNLQFILSFFDYNIYKDNKGRRFLELKK